MYIYIYQLELAQCGFVEVLSIKVGLVAIIARTLSSAELAVASRPYSSKVSGIPGD